MNKLIAPIAMLALLAASSVWAGSPAPTVPPAGTAAPAAEGTDTAEDAPLAPGDIFIAEPGETDYLAKDEVLGAKVHNKDGKIIGDIEDLIVDEDDQIIGVIMGVGGFVGVGEKKIGIKYEAFDWGEKEGKSYVTLPQADKALLEGAVAFKRRVAPKTLYDRALEKAQELRDKSAETAKPAIEKAKQQASEAYEKAKAAAKDAVDRATTTTPAQAPAPAPAPKPTP